MSCHSRSVHNVAMSVWGICVCRFRVQALRTRNSLGHQIVLFCHSDSVHNVAMSLCGNLSVGLEFRLYELETHSDTKLFCLSLRLGAQCCHESVGQFVCKFRVQAFRTLNSLGHEICAGFRFRLQAVRSRNSLGLARFNQGGLINLV